MKAKIISAIASDISELAKSLENQINKVLESVKKIRDIKISIAQDPFYRGYCAIALIIIEE